MPTETDRTLAEALSGIARADVIVGIPSYNNAKTIAHVVDMARQGLRHSFPALTGRDAQNGNASVQGSVRYLGSRNSSSPARRLSCRPIGCAQ